MPKSSTPNVQIFFVDSRFQQWARRDNGLPFETALTQAQLALDAAKADATRWLDRSLRRLDRLVHRIERTDGEPAALTETAWHALQVYEVAAMLDLELVAFAAIPLCDVDRADSRANVPAIAAHLSGLHDACAALSPAPRKSYARMLKARRTAPAEIQAGL